MSIPVSIYLQKEPVVCPQCGSTVRLTRDHCLRCMLSQAIGVSGDTSEMLNDLLTEIDFQDAACLAP
jgi:predicted amidophosphoribosyltransferase